MGPGNAERGLHINHLSSEGAGQSYDTQSQEHHAQPPLYRKEAIRYACGVRRFFRSPGAANLDRFRSPVPYRVGVCRCFHKINGLSREETRRPMNWPGMEHDAENLVHRVILADEYVSEIEDCSI